MFKEELLQLEDKGLLRYLRWVETEQAPHVIIDGKKTINLCSNNYLGLATHPDLKLASIEATQEYGTSSAASRLITGSMSLHRNLERKIAKFKNTETALLYNSGYTANLGIITSLVKKGDIIFSDKLNHASIIDGCLLSGAEFRRYPHKDVSSLDAMLKKSNKSKKRLIVTDAVFSMDGDIAPLPDLVGLAKKYDCLLMLDEAHATGVLGENGRGAVEHFGLDGKFDFIQMGTLGKALGSFGAYVAGRKDLIDYLINKSRPFIYTTALPPSVIAAATAALKVLDNSGSQLRKNLWEKVKFFRLSLNDMGFNTMESQTQIIPVLIGDNNQAVEFSRRLFEEGIFIQAIRPPTVPRPRLRISIMATHTRQDLERSLTALGKIGKDLGVIK